MENFRKKRDFGERPPEPSITIKGMTKIGTIVRGEINLMRPRWSVKRGMSITVDGILKTVHDFLWVAKNELHLVIT
jgi:hypothetical protein